MTLTEFLLARIAEDEESTRTASTPFYREMFNGWHRGEVGGAFIGFTDRFTPNRVLAECEAKRRIVTEAEEVSRHERKMAAMASVSYDTPTSGETILHLLAAVYADHPDYDPEWRP